LIIDELNDVSAAIDFAKEQDDRELWDDFLEYAMSRPRFISGLLSEVGMAIEPVRLVKRIPNGLEIEGLKEGLRKMLREYDLQDSISAGVARVLESEVAVGMQTLRVGRKQGIKFEVPAPKQRVEKSSDESGSSVQQQQQNDGAAVSIGQENEVPKHKEVEPGHCASCHRAFIPEGEKQTLVGFACGHVYHVAHLLYGPDAEDAGPSYLPDLHRNDGDGDEDEDDYPGRSGFSRSVGPKVTNARLLREKIASVGGCAVCEAKKERLKEVE
jgi:vacuolar protein sorting-associated protein 41